MAKIAFQGSGILLVFGAALLGLTVVRLAFKPATNPVLSPGVSRLLLASSILLLLSLPAVYVRQAGSASWLGLAGHALLQAGTLLLVVISAPPILYPSLNLATGENPVVFLLGIAFTLGLLLSGIAILYANVFPRWAGILLLAATAGFFFNFFVAEFLPPLAGQVGNAVFGVLLALSFGWIGVALFSAPAG